MEQTGKQVNWEEHYSEQYTPYKGVERWTKSTKINENITVYQDDQAVAAIMETKGKFRIIIGKQLVDTIEYDTKEEAAYRIMQTDWKMVAAMIQAFNNQGEENNE